MLRIADGGIEIRSLFKVAPVGAVEEPSVGWTDIRDEGDTLSCGQTQPVCP